MIDAVQAAVAQRGHDLLAEDLEELILNRSSAFKGKPERFKLWPSKHDRPAFAQALLLCQAAAGCKSDTAGCWVDYWGERLPERTPGVSGRLHQPALPLPDQRPRGSLQEFRAGDETWKHRHPWRPL
ncbi:hypothetical protein [Micromonospora sp. NPDC000442]|uniref:hypothetical protein n=1 Tax=Micromonospora sp. NPDC000442 TaxID=3364217 RepID=UPI0036C19C1A